MRETTPCSTLRPVLELDTSTSSCEPPLIIHLFSVRPAPPPSLCVCVCVCEGGWSEAKRGVLKVVESFDYIHKICVQLFFVCFFFAFFLFVLMLPATLFFFNTYFTDMWSLIHKRLGVYVIYMCDCVWGLQCVGVGVLLTSTNCCF